MHGRPRKPPSIAFTREGFALLALALLLSACGAATDARRVGEGREGDHAAATVTLAPGRGSAPAPVRLEGASRLAHRFARAWAAEVYRRRPPRLPGESAAVGRELAAAATRVPPARRGLRAHVLALRLRPAGPHSILASATFGDGRFPPFSVGFALVDRRDRWLVTAISPPD